MSYISLYTSVLFFLHSDQLQSENISQSKKKNSKYKTGIDYNEENNSMQGTKEVCCS